MYNHLNFKHLLLSLILLSGITKLMAQKVDFQKGYYVDVNNQAHHVFFDLDFLRQNRLEIKQSITDKKSIPLSINDVEKIILENGDKDTAIILTQKLNFKGQIEKIYIEYLLKGKVNLFRGFSEKENEVYYISSNELPDIRRINKANPRAFLMVYFKNCKVAESKIRQVYYDHTSLSQAIGKLSDCSDSIASPNQTKYKVRFNKSISLGITGTVGIIQPSIETNYFGSPIKVNSFSSGFGLNIQFNISNRLSIVTGFSYLQNNIVAKDSIGEQVKGDWGSNFLYKTKYDMDYSYLELTPIEVKYRWQIENKSIIPVFSLGIIYNKTISPVFKNSFDKTYSEYIQSPAFPFDWGLRNPPPPPVVNELIGREGKIGMFFTIGVQKQFNKKLSLEVLGKYTYTGEHVDIKALGFTEYFPFEFLTNSKRYSLMTQLIYTF
jgi:hypothetical protein